MGPQKTASLRVTELRKEYPTPGEPLVVLDWVHLELSPGESLAVTGPSGCGKSTLLHILGALDAPTSGRVMLGDIDPFALRDRELAAFRNQRIGFVFQEHHLLPQCSVLENVLVPTLVADGATAEAEARALGLLEQVGLSERLEHRPAELSGGERQRVAIARALIHAPDLLLCDEPTGNLDGASAEAVGDLFLQLHEKLKNLLVVVTHSLDLAARLGRHAELRGGRLIEASARKAPAS